MSFGKFLDNGGYLINNPDTPTKWDNKLFNDEYVLDITQRLEGRSSIVKNYSQTGLVDFSRRFYMNAGGESKRLFWGEVGNFSALYETDKMTVSEENEEYKIMAEVTVAEVGQREFWRFTIQNKKQEKVIYNMFCFYPFVNMGPMGGEVKLSDNRKYITKFYFPQHVTYEEKEIAEKNNNCYTYIISDSEITSFAGDAQSFYGSDNTEKIPVSVKNGKCSNTKGQGGRLDAGIHFSKMLEANEKVEISLVIGSAKTLTEIEKLSNEKFDFDEIYKKANEYRKSHFIGYNIETPNGEVNHLFNKWLPKQMTYLARLNRGGVYCPVRNQLQDALGYSMIDPKGALELALKVLRRQHINGYLKQWYMTDGSPERGLCKINHSDACVWLVLCVTEIINNYGDKSVFYQNESYMDSDIKESILEHLKKAVRYMYSMRGEHGLCLMLDGDWTDPINGAGRKGKGESVWNSMALIYAIHNLTSIFPDDELESIADNLKEAINDNCWDGEWYIAGFDDEGKAFGSNKDEEGKLFLNTQTWAIISGIVPKECMDKLNNSIEKLKVPFGWLLLDKPFEKWNETWGRISIKQPGTTENGSVYCHATMFKALSDCIKGDKEAAYDAVLRTLPTNPLNPAEKNLQLPLFVPNYYFGIDNENFGKSSCNYGTGTTAWLIWVMLKHILGINTTVNGICRNEMVTPSLKGTKVMRKFKGEEHTFLIN